jgi:ABC-2 type transport system permease protein/lipopolysaccharide transport system permease protein
MLGRVRELFAELIDYRELLVELTKSDIVVRYKQAVMGVAWAFFMPLAHTLVFTVIVRRVARVETGLPYPLFAYCGLLAWHFSASSWRFAATSLTSNISLITKVYLPREVFPFSAVLVALVDFAVGAVPLIGLMVYYRITPTATLAFLPVILLVHVMFTAAIALVLAMANLYYRDVKYLFEIAVTLWMFASSVVYPVEQIGGPLGAVLRANPMTPVIDAYRDVLLRGQLPEAVPFASAAAVAVIALGLAWNAFHAAEFSFAENV